MLGLFGRRPIKDVREGGWRRGDLAVCIRDDWEEPGSLCPQKGDILRVAGVQEAVERGVRAVFLRFETYPRREFFMSNGFRKVVRDDQAADDEFCALVRRGKRARMPEPVA